jgi:hypothetical protein
MDTEYSGTRPLDDDAYRQANAEIAAIARDFVASYRDYRAILQESGRNSGRTFVAKERLEAYFKKLSVAVDTHPYEQHLAEITEKHLDQYDPKRIHAGRMGRR